MSSPAGAIHPLHALRVLQPAGRALLEQLALYRPLVASEWAEEQRRLLWLLVAVLQLCACLLCLLLALGAAVVAWCWATRYRMPAIGAVCALYALGAGLAWWRVRALAAAGAQRFAGTRAELAADLALLRSRI